MLRAYKGGQRAPKGSYWNVHTGQFLELDGEACLPDGEGAYFRVSLPVLLLMGPILGLGFLLFLPLAVPVVIVSWAAQGLRSALSGRATAAGARPTRPARAH
jgi:hypothetical protein